MSQLLAYRPFVTPLPVWDYWYLLIIPLSLGISIVYKAIRLDAMKKVPLAALGITLWILGGMTAAAIALALLVRVL